MVTGHSILKASGRSAADENKLAESEINSRLRGNKRASDTERNLDAYHGKDERGRLENEKKPTGVHRDRADARCPKDPEE